ncbi:MAG TPA: rRNA maturation RNase YbeY [Lachnospiraceae bacterium]|nr:rRNA maturation RNase YbeY [Lachnospiraceae bacterium]
MTIQINDEQSIPLPFDHESLSREVIAAALDQEKCPFEAEISLTLVDNESIRRINREFRSIDSATDVLSFPLVPFPSPAGYEILEREDADDCFNPETGELMLGDIVISVERAKEQALEYGHSLRREFAFLIAHSMLHLLGYDHMSPEEASVMETRQEQILLNLNITREAGNS